MLLKSILLRHSVWPYGVITLLDELYIAESKSQVYGAIHSFFLNNENSMEDLSVIMYIHCAHVYRVHYAMSFEEIFSKFNQKSE